MTVSCVHIGELSSVLSLWRTILKLGMMEKMQGF